MATKKTISTTKAPELKKIIKSLESYREQLFHDQKVSATKFSHMQTAIHWAKQIVRDCYGEPREKKAIAWVK